MADFATLVTQRYLKPAAYIGQLITPNGGTLTGNPRIPLYVGKGSRYMLARNSAIRRSFVYEEQLVFPLVAPFEASLDFQSNGDKTRARIYTSGGTEVPQSRWVFQTDVVANDQILIKETEYDANLTYYIEYQSVERDVQDPIPYEDIHRVRKVSVNVDQEEFEEFVDFYLPTTIVAMTRDQATHDISASMSDIGTADGVYNEYVVGSCLAAASDMSSDAQGYIAGGERVHWTADTTNVVTVADAVSTLPEAIALANDLRTQCLAHWLEGATIHEATDVTNTITAVAATDLPSTQTLLNDIQAMFNYHISDDDSGVTGPGTLNTHWSKYDVVNASTAPAAADLGTSITLANELKALYNLHILYTQAKIGFASTSAYSHKYNREYELVLTVIGAGPDYTFRWQSVPQQPGYVFDSGATVPDPIQPPYPTALANDPGWGTVNTFTVDPAVPSSLTQTLENGIVLDFTDAVQAGSMPEFVALETFSFTAYGPGLVELDERLGASNQFTEYAVTKVVSGGATTGTLANATTSVYTGLRNRHFRLVCTAAVAATSATFHAVEFGEIEAGDTGFYETLGPYTLTPASPTATLDFGVAVTATFGTGFTIGDEFQVTVKAPQLFYKAHDNRYLRVLVTGVTDNWSDPAGVLPPGFGWTNTVDLYWVTTTYEGGFGTAQATLGMSGGSLLTTTTPYVDLGDNVMWCVRNMWPRPRHSSARGTSLTNDRHDATFTLNGTIDWDLQTQVTEVVDTDDIQLDGLGNVTGVPGVYYLRLNYTPLSISAVTMGGSPLAYTQVGSTNIIYFASMPTADVSVTYRHRGSEPDPGQVYYFTAEYLRPDEYYNTPIRLVGRERAKQFLEPIGTDNDLAIMAQIAWDAGGDALQAIYIVQVKDSDEDGVFTDFDYSTGITASEDTDACSDSIVLNRWTVLAEHLASLDRMADPFSGFTPTGFGKRLGWFGAPTTVPVGDMTTAGSLIYTAKNTLQVYGNSPAHGTRILFGSRECKTTILFEDTGLQQEVTLDGSFFAGAVAALVASFSDYGQTILRKIIGGLDEVEVWDNATDKLLGAAQIIYTENVGDDDNPVYRLGESFTTDNYAIDFQEISAMTQKQQMEVEVRNRLDQRTIAYVPRTQAEGVAYVKGQLVAVLKELVGSGYIAPYQDADGNVRKIDPNTDVKVAIREGSKTTYDYIYAAWLRYPIKYVFGLYTIDTNNFSIVA